MNPLAPSRLLCRDPRQLFVLLELRRPPTHFRFNLPRQPSSHKRRAVCRLRETMRTGVSHRLLHPPHVRLRPRQFGDLNPCTMMPMRNSAPRRTTAAELSRNEPPPSVEKMSPEQFGSIEDLRYMADRAGRRVQRNLGRRTFPIADVLGARPHPPRARPHPVALRSELLEPLGLESCERRNVRFGLRLGVLSFRVSERPGGNCKVLQFSVREERFDEFHSGQSRLAGKERRPCLRLKISQQRTACRQRSSVRWPRPAS